MYIEPLSYETLDQAIALVNSANQAIAQIIYEKRGLRIIGESEILGTQFKMLYRELEL